MPDAIVYDISNPLHAGTLAYPGDPAFALERIKHIGPESVYNLSRFTMGTHCGTHLDAPAHFIATGKNIDAFPPDRWISPALVVDVTADMIRPEHIPDDALAPGMAILFKTRNSAFLRAGEFPNDPCLLDPAAARKLAELKVHLVGIDWLTVESGAGDAFPVHEILLGNEILILESVLLDRVPAGRFTLYAAPLAIDGAEGAPARALLVSGA